MKKGPKAQFTLKAQIGLMVMNIRIARPRNALWRAILMHQQSTLDIFFCNSSQEKKSSHLFRCWSKLGGTSTTGTFSGTQLWVWQRCDLFNYWPTYLSLWPRYNHPTVATILEENGALDCNWPPHSMIRGVEMKTSGAQCYKLMWSFYLSKQIK